MGGARGAAPPPPLPPPLLPGCTCSRKGRCSGYVVATHTLCPKRTAGYTFLLIQDCHEPGQFS